MTFVYATSTSLALQ